MTLENRFMFARIDPKTREGEPGSAMSFIAATEGVKGDGMSLVMSGGDLTRYQKNPTVTWSHDMWGTRLPIGRAEVKVEGALLLADIVFDQDDEFAASVESKYRKGILNALSISWNTQERDNEEIVKWELIEIAAVVIPMDPDAILVSGRAALRNMRDSLVTYFEEDDKRKIEREKIKAEVDSAFPGLAVQMVRLFQSVGSIDEVDYKSRYDVLAKNYKDLEKDPPECVELKRLQAFGPAEIRGLFLEGEIEILSETMAGFDVDESNDHQETPDSRIVELFRHITNPEENAETVDPRLVELVKKLDNKEV